MIFTAIYGVVDGFFVSNYAGKTPFAAVNLIIPVLLFPLVWRLDGIWMSIVAAEVMAVVTTGIFLLAKRKRYGY